MIIMVSGVRSALSVIRLFKSLPLLPELGAFFCLEFWGSVNLLNVYNESIGKYLRG